MNEFYQQLREQVTRIWENISIQQKILFVAAPAVLLCAMGFAVYLASRPQLVTLVRLDNPAQLARITAKLDADNIKYETPNENTILIDKSQKPKAVMNLAAENLIGTDTGAGWSLFDKTSLGMTDRQFDVKNKRALQDELELTIVSGSDDITNARVHITNPEPSLFKEDAAVPTASVKLMANGSISKNRVVGVQNLVAASIPRLQPEHVIVIDKTNKQISESSDAETGVGMKSKQYDIQLWTENNLRSKLEDALYTMVGENNYKVTVNAVLDWTQERVEQTDIQSDSQAVTSEKAYEEEQSSPSISGPPGVNSNVQGQDTGIGAQTTMNSSIAETITNYQYPWLKRFVEEPIGEVEKISVSIALNYIEDEDTGERVQRQPEDLQKLVRMARTSVGLPPMESPDSMHNFVLEEIEFDETEARAMAREQLWKNITSIIKTILPLVLLFALGYFVYIFFQSAFAAPEIEMEEEEEIPIEPVTEAKELTLSQLGLAEFGDIASLPAEEQRRLKMQEHVINYAAEKPEEVAAIIKAWLSA
jgi:flagellar M-ring protein FliF